MEDCWGPSWFRVKIAIPYDVIIKVDTAKVKRDLSIIFQGIRWNGCNFQGYYEKRGFSGTVRDGISDNEAAVIELYRPFPQGKGKVNKELIKKVKRVLSDSYNLEISDKFL